MNSYGMVAVGVWVQVPVKCLDHAGGQRAPAERKQCPLGSGQENGSPTPTCGLGSPPAATSRRAQQGW